MYKYLFSPIYLAALFCIQTEEDTEEVVLNVKRETRLPPEDFVTEIEEFSTILCVKKKIIFKIF